MDEYFLLQHIRQTLFTSNYSRKSCYFDLVLGWKKFWKMVKNDSNFTIFKIWRGYWMGSLLPESNSMHHFWEVIFSTHKSKFVQKTLNYFGDNINFQELKKTSPQWMVRNDLSLFSKRLSIQCLIRHKTFSKTFSNFEILSHQSRGGY